MHSVWASGVLVLVYFVRFSLLFLFPSVCVFCAGIWQRVIQAKQYRDDEVNNKEQK